MYPFISPFQSFPSVSIPFSARFRSDFTPFNARFSPFIFSLSEGRIRDFHRRNGENGVPCYCLLLITLHQNHHIKMEKMDINGGLPTHSRTCRAPPC